MISRSFNIKTYVFFPLSSFGGAAAASDHVRPDPVDVVRAGRIAARTAGAPFRAQPGETRALELQLELDLARVRPVPAGAPGTPREPFEPTRPLRAQIPDEIANDVELTTAMKVLPENYDFEVKKTVWRLTGEREDAGAAVQGLFAARLTTLADIFQTFAGVRDVVILGDVTYGACCVDDYTAESLGCDFLVPRTLVSGARGRHEDEVFVRLRGHFP